MQQGLERVVKVEVRATNMAMRTPLNTCHSPVPPPQGLQLLPEFTNAETINANVEQDIPSLGEGV